MSYNPKKIPSILIIEDNPISRKVLKISLETEGYAVVEAADGASALQAASTQKFDLIIQDLFLPDMEACELNQKLREIPDVEKIPIFALSGFLNQLDKQARHCGFTTYLLKPIEPSYLLDVIKAHLPILMPEKLMTGKGKYILIADDNPLQLKLFDMQLRNLGFEVTSASDGAIALAEAKKRPPDAIISDILMPNMDGFSLCLEIRQDPNLKNIPVMLLTSHYLEDDDLALAEKMGANCYLTRTPDVEELIDKLLNIITIKSVSEIPVPFELTEEVKEKHNIRSIHQLEQQVQENGKLSKRCAMLTSQLSLLGRIADALTTKNKDIDESLKEVLYFCLDAIGISKGALYIKRVNNEMKLLQQIGYSKAEESIVESFFGIAHLMAQIVSKNELFSIPSEVFSNHKAKDFLEMAKVKSALIVPMYSGTECLGVLFLGSDMINLTGNNTREFIQTLGMQFGQSIALASIFDKLWASESRYRQLVEISPDAIFIQQSDKFVYANSSALALLSSKNKTTLVSHSSYDFFPKDYQANVKEYIDKNLNHELLPPLESKIINLKGDALDVEIVVSPFVYQGDKAIYMIMRDITERKLSALHLEVQYSIAWILAESSTLYAATGKILQIICERLNWDCGTIWAVDNEEKVMRCTRVWQNPEIYNAAFQDECLNITFAFGVAQPGLVWKDQKAIWQVNVATKDIFLRKTIAEMGLNTAVAFPILYEGKVLGMIEFFSKDTFNPNPDTLLWFESIGNQFGVFLMRKHMEKQMLYMAEHDVLTGLSNRSLFERYLNTALTVAKSSNQKLAVIFLDLDNFKYINDSMGHQIGDVLLKEISERFRVCIRPEDTISRLGGDEFIIIAPNIHNKDEVISIIARLQGQLSRKVLLKNKEVFITASVGVSFYPEDGDTVQTLIKGADIAMYAAKEKGRNNFQFCTSEMTVKAENQGILLNNLRLGLENNEFILYYQPKIDVVTQTISGVEALVRWNRPEGIILPGNFIPTLEGSDLIIPFGEWVLKTACLQNMAWQTAGLPTITMSVNLSIKNLNTNLLHIMEKTLRETHIPPDSLEIELTESVLMENVENNIQVLRSLKDMGVKISIDDFGTGYSSLSYLKRFPIDIIKIDQSFVRDIATDADDAAIVTAIIAMAHSLNFKVIAEGVETLAQLKFLCNHGCDEIQGFYFSRALPVSDATSFIRDAKITW